MGLGGIARSEIDCRDAHRAEACDIGPSELGTSVTADRPEKFSSSRLVEAGSGTGGYINDLDGIAIQDFSYVGLGLGCGLVRGNR